MNLRKHCYSSPAQLLGSLCPVFDHVFCCRPWHVGSLLWNATAGALHGNIAGMIAGDILGHCDVQVCVMHIMFGGARV